MDISLQFGTVDPYQDLGDFTLLSFTPFYPPELGCVGFDISVGPIVNGTTDVVARVTRIGIENMMQSIAYGNSFKITEMALGTGGYDTAIPTQALPVDADKLTLDSEIYRKPIDQYEEPNDLGSKGFVARFKPTDFVGGVGEVAIIATFLSHVDPAQVGKKFTFAIGHVGLQTKTQHSAVTYRIFVTI